MRTLTASLLVPLALSAHGQQCGSFVLSGCATTISPSTIVVSSTTTQDAGYTCFWVCGGDTLYLTGAENSVWVEPGGTVIIDPMGSNYLISTEIGLKDGAHLIVNLDTTGWGSGPFDAVWYAPTADIVDPNGWFQQFPCTSVVFDYGQAPAQGCDTTQTTGIRDRAVQAPVIHADPTNRLVLIDLPPGDWSADLIDMRGVQMQRRKGEGRLTIPLQDVASGVYNLVLEQGGQRYVRQVVVE
ncbi:MAG: T9SS type A sorting domain-containing protein [Flavobacteriales bacterium]|nr:T9SS type A sorting domain-containing protein [Flavobacteriales bacterium]MCB9166856.1 T9SS type A sorting domain-containing protein [Flavobacteriales bacterium]MCB9170554.1 T9SS type A sorting domain-containing protein [Flavobacteriales bacterium]